MRCDWKMINSWFDSFLFSVKIWTFVKIEIYLISMTMVDSRRWGSFQVARWRFWRFEVEVIKIFTLCKILCYFQWCHSFLNKMPTNLDIWANIIRKKNVLEGTKSIFRFSFFGTPVIQKQKYIKKTLYRDREMGIFS